MEYNIEDEKTKKLFVNILSQIFHPAILRNHEGRHKGLIDLEKFVQDGGKKIVEYFHCIG